MVALNPFLHKELQDDDVDMQSVACMAQTFVHILTQANRLVDEMVATLEE